MTPESSKLITFKLNDKEVSSEERTILQACQKEGIEIPVLCYHEKLSVAGNCRMCFVEIKGFKKPIASCAMPLEEGMEIYTNTSLVTEARKNNLEFLLINHPLECPICDKGGECDLQDITVAYGKASTLSFPDPKRTVLDKDMGPLIKTSMNRCIYCTRCIRFATEITGVPELGAFGRGEETEIGTYLQHSIMSELSGNLIDICPVGALTSKPSPLTRPWELEGIATIDVMDAVGSNIQIDVRKGQIMRVVPRANEDINESWISDKARFSYDGLRAQRLDQPYIRKDGKLHPASWIEAFKLIVKTMTSFAPHEMGFLAGDLVDVESVYLLRQLLDSMEAPHRDCRQEGSYIPTESRSDYLFNTTIQGIEDADCCVIIGSNPRLDASLINARLRKRFLKGNFKVGLIGPKVDLTYPYEHLGETALVLNELASATHPFGKVLKKSNNPMLILGDNALSSLEGESIYKTCRSLAEKFNMIRADWNGFNVLHKAGGGVGALDVGFIPLESGYDTFGIQKAAKSGYIKLIYLLGVDELPMESLGDAFVIYQGHHGDAGANRADIILPGAAYTEKDAFYVNTEGRVQQARRVLLPPGEAKEDWKIIRGLSEVLGHKLDYEVREDILYDLKTKYPAFCRVGELLPSGSMSKNFLPEEIFKGLLRKPLDNFYMTNPICRASQIMANCVREIWNPQEHQKKGYRI